MSHSNWDSELADKVSVELSEAEMDLCKRCPSASFRWYWFWSAEGQRWRIIIDMRVNDKWMESPFFPCHKHIAFTTKAAAMSLGQSYDRITGSKTHPPYSETNAR